MAGLTFQEQQCCFLHPQVVSGTRPQGTALLCAPVRHCVCTNRTTYCRRIQRWHMYQAVCAGCCVGARRHGWLLHSKTTDLLLIDHGSDVVTA